MDENTKVDYHKLMESMFGSKEETTDATPETKNNLFKKTEIKTRLSFLRFLFAKPSFSLASKKSLAFVTGLDIGVSAVKSALFSHKGPGPGRLMTLDMEEITHDNFESPTRLEIIRENIKKIQSRHAIQGKVFVSLPLPNLLVELMYLPVMPQAELDKAVYWEAKEKLLIDEGTNIIDYMILGEVKVAQQAQNEILFFSIPKKDVLENYRVLTGLGLRIATIRPNFLAAFQGFENKSLWKEEEVVGFLDIGAGSSQFSIISSGYLRFNRRVNVSADSITRSIADYCRVSYEEAERYKRDIGLSRMALEEDRKDGGVSDQPLVRISHAVGLHLDQLITEIQHTFHYFALQVSNTPVSKMDRLILTGGGASIKGVVEFFKNRLNIPVDIPDPFNYLQAELDKTNSARLLESNLRFAAAIGLAQTGY